MLRDLRQAAESVVPQFYPCEWRKYQSADLPMWARSFQKRAHIQLSSAAAERDIFTSTKFIWKTIGMVIRRLYSNICDDAVQL